MNVILKRLANAVKHRRFKRGRGALNCGGRFCPLGYLCEMFRRETGRGEWRSNPDSSRPKSFVLGLYVSSVLPPPEVLNWANYYGSKRLIMVNDRSSSTAVDVAACIEGF